ncbi:hypothetical protein [Burkholderia glumae]|uniref:Uncharacterized protein n=2 Tax=Burkholderia glumae TaxID=337 RepID=A0AAP9XWA7_BURGL|nr:hypothetical protein [Burkholderia glumae]AJY63351.1 hypothetical protein KS03_5086 [Burkholderia glumae LMG 2196 = ATCC 33617]KHJ60602.1 hypothetical protein NCPPB3923_23230 [Burkholderia glumae]MCM2483425.1 hypothetical protein [Burkholderia glumae]MCM2493769.1 hypothetical protein [Burkholderia glumae]MCM2511327.1 hypothetical protein [Burkholderia glumae]
MNRRSALPALLIGALLGTAPGARADVIDQGMRDAAAGSTKSRTDAPARCRPAPLLRADGNSLFGTGMGLASLAVLAAGASMFAPSGNPRGLLFAPPCDPRRIAGTSPGGYPFVPPSSPAAPPAAAQ